MWKRTTTISIEVVLMRTRPMSCDVGMRDVTTFNSSGARSKLWDIPILIRLCDAIWKPCVKKSQAMCQKLPAWTTFRRKRPCGSSSVISRIEMKRSARNWQPFVRKVETAETLYQLVQEFLQMVRKLQGERLEAWCASVAQRGIEELQRFANGLQQDKAAVLMGLTHSHNNAQAEGQVTRIKLDPRE